ncbi:hypothetical protein CCACVL1_24008 [Corchorus capsularis]|uniref:Uncharacterized protein n=1 Tax=Corchorus capsularis TaxID=210143 RepID=A0A1R3GR91_COCAP|nr:hypothetical protein CCACVL1_24008 [Corchorus capsularis]
MGKGKQERLKRKKEAGPFYCKLCDNGRPFDIKDGLTAHFNNLHKRHGAVSKRFSSGETKMTKMRRMPISWILIVIDHRRAPLFTGRVVTVLFDRTFGGQKIKGINKVAVAAAGSALKLDGSYTTKVWP